jgi:hypothetical protein
VVIAVRRIHVHRRRVQARYFTSEQTLRPPFSLQQALQFNLDHHPEALGTLGRNLKTCQPYAVDRYAVYRITHDLTNS